MSPNELTTCENGPLSNLPKTIIGGIQYNASANQEATDIPTAPAALDSQACQHRPGSQTLKRSLTVFSFASSLLCARAIAKKFTKHIL